MKSLTVSSKPENIALVEKFIDEMRSEINIGDDVYGNILISITEAANNAIIHGNQLDENKFVQIGLRCRQNKLIFTVSDEGKGFDPNNVPDPTLEANLECCGGRGVFIINQLSHAVRYLNNGSTIKIIFKI